MEGKKEQPPKYACRTKKTSRTTLACCNLVRHGVSFPTPTKQQPPRAVHSIGGLNRLGFGIGKVQYLTQNKPPT